LKRLEQQLATDFERLPRRAGVRRFVMADVAQTARRNGHAWIGLKAETDVRSAPKEVILHVRLRSEKTETQKDDLATIGVKILDQLYTNGKISLAEIRAPEYEFDYARIPEVSSPVTQAMQLLQLQMTSAVAFDANGNMAAPHDLFDGASSPKFRHYRISKADLQNKDSSGMQRALRDSLNAAEPLFVFARDITSEEFFSDLRYKEPRQSDEQKLENRRPVEPLEKVQALNSERKYIFSVIDVGGRQKLADLIFDARNVSALFRSRMMNSLDELKNTNLSTDIPGPLPIEVRRLAAELDQELITIQSNRPHLRAVIGNLSTLKKNSLEGYIAIRGETVAKGPIETLIIKYTFPFNRSAKYIFREVASLSINAIYAFTHASDLNHSVLSSLQEGTDVQPSQIKILNVPQGLFRH
jgi:hypothetical protein